MNNGSWNSSQAQGQVQVQGVDSSGIPAQTMESGDWRTTLQADSRDRIVNKIMETLKRHLPVSGQEGIQELKKIAVRFEEKIFSAATSQSDYLRKISLKMLTMESKSQNPMAASNSAGNSKNQLDPASQNRQTQVNNQGQALPHQTMTNQPQLRQQLLPQSIPNSIASSGVQNSASLASTLPPGSGLTQATMPSVGQNSSLQNMQNIPNAAQNSGGNAMGQGVPSNMFANSQRPIQGRQQQAVTQQQQQQSQNAQQYIYNQQLQQQLMKQKFQSGNITQPLMQSQQQQPQQLQQQQNLLQSGQVQSSQQAVMQPPIMQSAPMSGLQQNQQSSAQQSTQSMIQQQQQAVLRQHQQPQQVSMIHQQQPSMQQQPMLQSQHQQQLIGQQPNVTNSQQNQLIAQQSSMSGMHQQQQPQQQRLMGQQNNLSNLQQQQLIGQQNHLSNMHQQQLASQSGLQQQPQQMLGSQSSNSGMRPNQQNVLLLQQPKVPVQQPMQHGTTNLLPTQAQPSQPPPPTQQQQMMSNLQSQSGQLRQQQANPLQRDIQQRLQTSSPLLQQQNVIDQQKQLFQSQRATPEASSASLNSTAQTGNANTGDWQEEVYQKIKTMREMYFTEISEMYQKIASKLQQHDSLPQQPKNDQLEKLRVFKLMLERLMQYLRLNKNEIQLVHEEKLSHIEKQIIYFLNSNRPRKPVQLQQGQLPQMQAMPPSQQSQSHINQIQSHENQMNPQMQAMNVQGPAAEMQQHSLTNLQNNSLSSASSIPNSQQSMITSLQSGANLDSGQSNSLNSLQQLGIGSLQQNHVSGPINTNSLSSQSGMNTMQTNLNPNMLQQQHSKQQEHQMLQTQQLKQQQIQQRQLQQQQLMHRQQLLHQQAKQQPGQFNAHQMSQLHQMTDVNDLKMRQQLNVKQGVFQQNQLSGQRSASHHQQLKPGSSFSIPSQQVLQAVSPQIPPHASPQIDQQSLLSSLTKAGTPLQSANSPFIVPSPSTPLAPSPMPGESEKVNSGISSLSNAANLGHQPTAITSAPAQSLAIGTPGISASPLLAEFSSPDGIHGNISATVPGKSSTEHPLDRLIRAVKSSSAKALASSVSDISSVVSMVDRIAGSAPGNGSRAAVGEDLVAMTKCRLQARNFFTQDGSGGTKKMRRYVSAMPSNVVSSTGSVNEASDLESTATSAAKKPRIEVNHALVEEIRKINRRLIDTVVDISDEDVDPMAVSATAEGGEGTIVKCTYTAVALSPNLKSQYTSAQMSPIQPLRLFVPNNYPNCSPVLLDKFPVEVSKEFEDLSMKAKSRFSISLRSLSQPMSLGEIAKAWDACVRAVILEYARKSGGGSFSSKYGTWEPVTAS